MQATNHLEVNTGAIPQVRELVRTIVDAATALARLLPDKELEQGFEFPWGHSDSSATGMARDNGVFNKLLPGFLAGVMHELVCSQGEY